MVEGHSKAQSFLMKNANAELAASKDELIQKMRANKKQ